MLSFGKAAGWLAVVALIAGGAWGQEEPLSIRLERPEKVGAKYRYKANATRETTTTTFAGGKLTGPAQRQRLRVTLDALEEVLSVDERGRVTSSVFTVQAGSVSTGGPPQALMGKGDQVTASTRGPLMMYFEIKQNSDKPSAPDLAEALGAVINYLSIDATEDEIFGSTDPRRIGEKWPIHVEKLIEVTKESGVQIGQSSVEGESRLVGVRGYGGVQCMVVETGFSAQNLLPPLWGIPSGLRVRTGKITATQRHTLPLDLETPKRADSITVSLDLRSPGDGNAESRVVLRQQLSIERVPIP